MICIVESGSTKADWALLSEEGDLFQTFTTPGMNPVVGYDEKRVRKRIHSVLFSMDDLNIEKVYFFGAGCVHGKANLKIDRFLQKTFNNKLETHIASDLKGAAIACYGEKKGLIGILGTGSSAAFFNGKKIEEKAGSLGYLISDDGSGFHIGRQILRHYFHQQMPEEIREEFEDLYHKELRDIYNVIYKKEKPNAEVASFTKFLVEISTEPFVTEILQASFDSFFRNIVSQLEDYSDDHKISFVGSVAYHYAQHLRQSAERFNYEVGHIIERPISRLVFHYRQKLLNSAK